MKYDIKRLSIDYLVCTISIKVNHNEVIDVILYKLLFVKKFVKNYHKNFPTLINFTVFKATYYLTFGGKIISFLGNFIASSIFSSQDNGFLENFKII